MSHKTSALIPALLLACAARAWALPPSGEARPGVRDPLEAELDACYERLPSLAEAPPFSHSDASAPRWRQVARLPEFKDDLLLSPVLSVAIPRTIDYWSQHPGATVSIADRSYSAAHIIRGLQALAQVLGESTDASALRRGLESRFDIYQSLPDAPGDGDQGTVTAYCTPDIRISPLPTPEAPAPIYSAPRSPVNFTRKEISEGKLAGQGLELGWANLVDLMTTQVEGSAWGVSGGRRFLLSYDGGNGHAWRSVIGSLKACGIDLKRFPGCEGAASYAQELACMRALPFNLQRKLVDLDPSYVFFRLADGGPTGFLQVELLAGRSIAVDRRVVPLGLPGLLASSRPASGDFARIVFTHDVGGAIKGGGRVDLYAGEGPEAQTDCNGMHSPGRLYIFVLKP